MFHKGNYKQMSEDIANTDWGSLLQGNIQNCWSTFAELLNKYQDKHIQKKLR